jgi:hypothetical protein
MLFTVFMNNAEQHQTSRGLLPDLASSFNDFGFTNSYIQ